MEQDIQIIQSQLAELERKVEALIYAPSLNRNLDNQSKDIIKQEVSKKIMDIVWDEYYHYHTFFEAAGATDGTNGWVISDSGLNSGVDSTGVFLETGSVDGDSTFILKAPLYQNILSFDLESRFRTAVFFGSDSDTATGASAEMQAFIGGGNGYLSATLSTNLDYYGFALEGSNLYGCTANGSTGTKKLALANIQYEHLYLLEARYQPGVKATFYVSDGTAFPSIPSLSTRAKERCSIDTTLPNGDGTLTRFQVRTDENMDKSLGIGFYEYLQRRLPY